MLVYPVIKELIFWATIILILWVGLRSYRTSKRMEKIGDDWDVLALQLRDKLKGWTPGKFDQKPDISVNMHDYATHADVARAIEKSEYTTRSAFTRKS